MCPVHLPRSLVRGFFVRLTVLSLAGVGSAWGFDVTGDSSPDGDLWVVLDGVAVLAVCCAAGETCSVSDGKSTVGFDTEAVGEVLSRTSSS